MKQKLLKRIFLAAVLLGVGVSDSTISAQEVWDFTNTSVWGNQTSKGKSANYKELATGSEVWFAADGSSATSETSNVSFKFQTDGAKFNYGGTYALGITGTKETVTGNYDSENDINYVKINIPVGYRVYVEYVVGSTGRPIWTKLGSDDAASHTSSSTYSCTNETEAAQTLLVYATNGAGSNYSNHYIKKITMINTASVTAHTWTATAYATIGGVKTQIDTWTGDEYYEAEPYSVWAKKVISYGGNYYELDDARFDSKVYYSTTMGTETTAYQYEITYSLAEDIAYYCEGESKNSSQKKDSKVASGGQYVYYVSGRFDASIAQKGVYRMETNVIERGSNSSLYVFDGDGVVLNNQLNKPGNGYKTTANFLVSSDNATIKIGLESGNNTLSFDYVIIRKIADITNTSNIVGDINYATNYATAWNGTAVTIDVDTKGYYKIRNFNNTSSANLYENWYLWAATTASKNQTAFGPNHANVLYEGLDADPYTRTYSSKPTFTMADLNGATVELEAQLTDAGDGTYTLTVTGVTTKADGTQLSPNLVYVQTGFSVNTLNLYASVEKSFLEVLEQRTFPATVSKTITTAGWATYCSPYALDLEHATNLTDAYIITGGADGVLAKTSVKDGTVPANTGLLLKGTDGSAVEVTIPVVASSSTDVSDNKLEGVTADTPIAANAGYVLMASPSLGFYKNAKAFTVGANTAYLPLDFDATSARGFFLLDGDATGINAINGSESTVNGSDIYNLQGQRVEKATKGLYIVNGKKVLVK